MELIGFQPYKVNKVEGYSPAISYLICMMMHTRSVTLESVKSLSPVELDYLLDERSNSIGALLAHIAATEKWYQAYSFEKRELEGQELELIIAALDLGERGRTEIRGRSLRSYIEELTLVREKTLSEMRQRDDSWLMEERPFTKTAKSNNLYIWYHVFEDEINHRGQINLIKKRIKT